jgi:hypothetical protein
VLAADVEREEIFVLARTNRQLNELSELMRQRGIRHVVRSDETSRSAVAGSGEIHLPQSMQSKAWRLSGLCGRLHQPELSLQGSEHPIIDMIKLDEYDKEAEERRLFMWL